MGKLLEGVVMVMCLRGIALGGTAVASGQVQAHSLPTSQALEGARSKPLIRSVPVGWKIVPCEPVPENLHLRPLTCLDGPDGAIIWFHTMAQQSHAELDAFMRGRDGTPESPIPSAFLKNENTAPYILVGDIRRRERGQFALFIGGQRPVGDSFVCVYNAPSKETFDGSLGVASSVFNQAFDKLRDVATLEGRLGDQQAREQRPTAGPTTPPSPQSLSSKAPIGVDVVSTTERLLRELEKARAQALMQPLPASWVTIACPVSQNDFRYVACAQGPEDTVAQLAMLPAIDKDDLARRLNRTAGTVQPSLMPKITLGESAYSLVGDVRLTPSGVVLMQVGGARIQGESFFFVAGGPDESRFRRYLGVMVDLLRDTHSKLAAVARLEQQLFTADAPVAASFRTASYSLLRGQAAMVRVGMTYAEVVEIFGREGKPLGNQVSNGVESITCFWDEQAYTGTRTLYATFTNGHLTRKDLWDRDR
jgi:hypothetical protein